MATAKLEKAQSSRAITKKSQQTTISTETDASGFSAADSGFQFFFEDEVYRIDKKGRVIFGLVVETCDSYSDDEEEEYDEVLDKGEVRVSWYPDGKEIVSDETAIGLADRTLMPGDVVRRMVPGKETQRGYCREISMQADVQVLGSKYVIQNVATERLRLISVWQRDSAVYLDSWVGSAKDVEEKAILKTASGTKIEISSSDFYSFKDGQTPTVGCFNTNIFFPGNVVVGRPPSLDCIKLLTPEKPLLANNKGKPLHCKYEVESLSTDSVWVNWQCKALSEDGALPTQSPIQQPAGRVRGEDLKRLKRLNLFESCMQQISDRNYLTYSKFDKVIKKSDWEKEQATKFKKIQSDQSPIQTDIKSTNSNSNSSAGYHNAKPKKRISHFDIDKSNKSKKHQNKLEKSISLGKDRCKHQGSEKTSNHNLNTATDLNKTGSDMDWISDDTIGEEDGDEVETSNLNSILSTSSLSAYNNSKHNSRRNGKKLSKPSSKVSVPSPTNKDCNPKDGDELVVETLLVYSTITVVWQDGTTETGVASTDLYPIHHLDNHEFFPGDYVASNKEGLDISQRDYGVVQTVDYSQRTARVKWFTTYASANEPKPNYKGESEVSVYDLKDHSDFQYRPGTMVIRVANFVGEDSKSTAGQIIDNFPDGRSKVWWVDGHISMCYPQDLFEVGQYDGQADWDNESESSWETESENSLQSEDDSSSQEESSETVVLSLISQAKISIESLGRRLIENPQMQNAEVMNKLYGIYRSCRYLDRIAYTKFFVDSNFKGLIEKVRLASTQLIAERAQHRLNRLFNDTTILSCTHQQIPLNPFPISPTTPTTPPITPSTPEVESVPVLKRSKSDTQQVSHCDKNGDYKIEEKTRLSMDNGPILTIDDSIHVSHNALPIIDDAYTPKFINGCLATSLTDLFGAPGNSDNHTRYADYTFAEITVCLNKAYEKSTLCKSSKNLGKYAVQVQSLCSSAKGSSISDFLKEHNNRFDNNKDIDDSVYTGPLELVSARFCSLLAVQLSRLMCFLNELLAKFESSTENLSNEQKIESSPNSEIENLINTEIIANSSESAKAIEDMINDYIMPISETNNGNDKLNTEDLQAEKVRSTICSGDEHFKVLSETPTSHFYACNVCQPANPQTYFKAIQREHRLLRSSLPPGVWVKIFEDRMDLLSVMIEGPKKTPYEDGLFLFDIQLGREYPKRPPVCHYISFCSDRLNPNLYEDGKVCVSLLGTWSGRDTEVWGSDSTLLQVIVSIQGLILVAEPYYNEAGYEKQIGSQQGKENSRMYNEMAIIKLVQATIKMMLNPPIIFKEEIVQHFVKNGRAMHDRVKGWAEHNKENLKTELSSKAEEDKVKIETDEENKLVLPEFTLLPASRGFGLSIFGLLDTFLVNLNTLIAASAESTET